MTPDIINSFFTCGVGLFTSLNVYRALKDHSIKGVSIWAALFFCSGAYWNLYYYHAIHQPVSFLFSVWAAVASAFYLALFVKFHHIKTKCFNPPTNLFKRPECEQEFCPCPEKCQKADKCFDLEKQPTEHDMRVARDAAVKKMLLAIGDSNYEK